MQDRLINKIDDKLYFEMLKTTQKPITELEHKLNRCFNIITEDIGQYLKIINKPWGIGTDKLMNHLRSVSLEELADWIDALKIVIIDRGIQNRWTLSLVRSTKSNLQLPDQFKSSINLMIDSMDATKPDTTAV